MPRCKICGQSKVTDEFYQYTSGRTDSYCRDCRKQKTRDNCDDNQLERIKKWQARNKKKVRGYKEDYEQYNTENRRFSARLYRETSPEKVKAHQKVSYALKVGKLVKPSECSQCGRKIKLNAHHDDYTKPLDIRWLCVTCHRLHHEAHDK